MNNDRHGLPNHYRTSAGRSRVAGGRSSTGITMFFNGNSYVDCGNQTTFDSATRCTVAMWVDFATWPAADKGLFSINSSSKRKIDIRTKTGAGEINISLGSGSAPSTISTLSQFYGAGSTGWNFLCMTYAGDGAAYGDNDGRLKLYSGTTALSCSHVPTNPVPGTLTSAENNLMFIGALGGSVEGGGGSNSLPNSYMSNVAIWTGVSATQEQVAELYNSGSLANLNWNDTTLGSPCHWWHMGGLSGSTDTYPTIIDHGVSGANGTIQGGNKSTAFVNTPTPGTAWADTYSAHSPAGAISYVDCGNVKAPLSGGQEWTISSWVRATDTINGQGMMMKGFDEPCFATYLTGTNGNQIITLMSGVGVAAKTTWTSSGSAWNVGQWHHVVHAFSGNNPRTDRRYKCYVDGQELGGAWTSDPITTMPLNDENFVIGSGSLGSGTITALTDGNIDEVVIWDKALSSSAEVSTMVTKFGRPADPSTSCLGAPTHYWSFDDRSDAGNQFYDETGVRHGTVMGEVSSSIDVPLSGTHPQSFKGVRASLTNIKATATDALSGSTAFTIGWWHNFKTTPGGGQIHCMLCSNDVDGTSGQFLFYISSTDVKMHINDGSGWSNYIQWTPNPLPDWKTWQHCTFTFMTGSGNLWINGVNKGSGSWVGSQQSVLQGTGLNTTFGIGARTSVPVLYAFDGLIKDVFIHSGTEYSEADVLTCYNGGIPIDMRSGPQGNPSHYWKMDRLHQEYPIVQDLGAYATHVTGVYTNTTSVNISNDVPPEG